MSHKSTYHIKMKDFYPIMSVCMEPDCSVGYAIWINPEGNRFQLLKSGTFCPNAEPAATWWWQAKNTFTALRLWYGIHNCKTLYLDWDMEQIKASKKLCCLAGMLMSIPTHEVGSCHPCSSWDDGEDAEELTRFVFIRTKADIEDPLEARAVAMGLSVTGQLFKKGKK